LALNQPFVEACFPISSGHVRPPNSNVQRICGDAKWFLARRHLRAILTP
jgi:hypothetical protein